MCGQGWQLEAELHADFCYRMPCLDVLLDQGVADSRIGVARDGVPLSKIGFVPGVNGSHSC